MRRIEVDENEFSFGNLLPVPDYEEMLRKSIATKKKMSILEVASSEAGSDQPKAKRTKTDIHPDDEVHSYEEEEGAGSKSLQESAVINWARKVALKIATVYIPECVACSNEFNFEFYK